MAKEAENGENENSLTRCSFKRMPEDGRIVSNQLRFERCLNILSLQAFKSWEGETSVERSLFKFTSDKDEALKVLLVNSAL